MYTPDPSFRRQLQLIDPLLDVRWHNQRQRWQIDRLVEDEALISTIRVHIMYVEDPDGHFMPLDERTLQRLRLADCRNRDPARVIREAMKEQAHREHMFNTQNHADAVYMAKEQAQAARKDLEAMGSRNWPIEDERAAFEGQFDERTLDGEVKPVDTPRPAL